MPRTAAPEKVQEKLGKIGEKHAKRVVRELKKASGTSKSLKKNSRLFKKAFSVALREILADTVSTLKDKETTRANKAAAKVARSKATGKPARRGRRAKRTEDVEEEENVLDEEDPVADIKDDDSRSKRKPKTSKVADDDLEDDELDDDLDDELDDDL